MTDPEALNIVKHVRDDDGIKALLQMHCRFDPQTALTKSYRLKAIQKVSEKNRAKKNIDVPRVLARFDDLLLK